MRPLTERQTRFSDEYIRTGNIRLSAINAGYSEKTAGVIGNENLSKPNIKAYIGERLEKLRKESIAEQDEVMQLLTSVARGELQASTLIGVGGGEERIADNMPPTMQERIKAAELLGKRYALFTEKVEQTNRNIEIDVGEWDED